MKFKLRLNFQQRLLLCFLALLLVSSGASILASIYSSSSYFSQSLNEKLMTGREVVEIYLENRAAQLATSVSVLVNDWGFKSAVATSDIETIDGVLVNHAARIGADLAILSDVDGKTLSATEGVFAEARVDLSSASAVTSRIQKIGDGLYQTFVLPVEAPHHIGWITMAFELDQVLATELAQITHLEVTFVSLSGERFVSSRREPGVFATLGTTQFSDFRAAIDLERDYVGAVSELSAGERPIYLLLQASTTVVDEATFTLAKDLLSIFAVALCLCLLISMWFARRISSPVGSLVQAARRIRGGDYGRRVEVISGGELAILGDAMNSMMAGIGEREEKITRQAFNDSDTGLANRTRFTAEFEARGDTQFCMVLLSILDLKDIAFSYGDTVGRDFKVAVAKRLVEQMAPIPGKVYAFSDNELALFLPDCEVKKAQLLVTETITELTRPYEVADWQIATAIAGSVVSYPDDARNCEQLLHRLQSTLDRAIAAKAKCLTYLAEEEEVRHRQLRIIASLDEALGDEQFHLCFQPKVSVAEERASEAEVLLRWNHPELGFIPPDEFIPLVERSGNIQRVTSWVLAKAISQAASWAQQGMNLKLAVNISAHDLMNPALAAQIRDLCAKFGADGSMLTIEVTESAVLEDEARAIEALIRLKRMGITLSIDDFGTGFSSLAQLKNLPIDELKIDKAFVLELDQSPDDLQIVRSTIDLGHNLGLRIVAEGVENRRSFELLRKYGCDTAQGYHFSKPLPAADFEDWYMSYNAGDATQEARASA